MSEEFRVKNVNILQGRLYALNLRMEYHSESTFLLFLLTPKYSTMRMEDACNYKTYYKTYIRGV